MLSLNHPCIKKMSRKVGGCRLEGSMLSRKNCDHCSIGDSFGNNIEVLFSCNVKSTDLANRCDLQRRGRDALESYIPIACVKSIHNA